MELYEKTLSEEEIYKGRVIDVRLQRVQLPNGRESKREIVRHQNAVAILAIDDDGNVLLVEQFRKPIDSVILEIPAGHVEAVRSLYTQPQGSLRRRRAWRQPR